MAPVKEAARVAAEAARVATVAEDAAVEMPADGRVPVGLAVAVMAQVA